MFGTKDPAVEEKRAAGILEALEKNLTDVQAKQRNIENELIQKKSRSNRTGKIDLRKNNEKLVREERKWKEELEHSGFMTEENGKRANFLIRNSRIDGKLLMHTVRASLQRKMKYHNYKRGKMKRLCRIKRS